MKRVIEFDCDGLSSSDAEQLERWQKNRSRVRPFAGYGEDTILYMSPQRANYDGSFECQIGPDPDTISSSMATGTASFSRRGSDGLLYLLDDNELRFEKCSFSKAPGLNGIRLNDRHYQHFIRSHPETGFTLWSTKTGSPTLSIVDYPSVVSGQTKVTKILMSAGDKVRQVESLIGDTGTKSAFFYLKGNGYVTVDVRDFTTQVVKVSDALQLSDHEWTQVVLEGFTKASGDAYEFVISASTDCLVYSSAQQLEDQQTVNPYIHNMSLSVVRGNHTGITWNDFQVPETGSIFAFVVKPSVNGDSSNRWIVGQENTNPNRFGFRTRASDGLLQLHKGTKTVSGTYTQLPGGQLSLVAACWDIADYRTFYEGTKTGTSAAILTTESIKAGLNIGDPEINFRCHSGNIAMIRIDSRKLTDAQMEVESDKWADSETYLWTLACEGRDFEIKSLALRTREGDATEYSGRVILQEVYSYETNTVELK